MSIKSETAATGAPSWGSFALVSYLPEPLGSYLTGLRQVAAGEHRPEAHITFLPPRPLSVPMEEAAAETRRLLEGVEPFEVELGSVRVFPQTNILYLSLEEGTDSVLDLHALLNQGKLFANEDFEFIPHLTLSGALPPAEVDEALNQTESAWKISSHLRRFLVSDVVLLWQDDRDWLRLSSYPLTRKSSKNAAGKT